MKFDEHKLKIIKTMNYGAFLLFLLFLFTPIVQIVALSGSNSFCFNLINILCLNKKFFYVNDLKINLGFSNVAQLFAAMVVLFFIIGFVCFCFKKFKISALAFVLSVCCLFEFVSEFNIIKNKLLNQQINNSKIYVTFLWPLFLFVCLGLTMAVFALKNISFNYLIETIFFVFASITLICVLFIGIYVLCEGMPAIKKIGFLNLVFGKKWNPSFNEFGVFNLLTSSILATIGAILIAAPLGIFTAIFMAEMCSKKLLVFLNQLVNLFAGVPSVVFGFFGMIVIVPAIKKTFFNLTTSSGKPVVGDSLLAVIVVLTLMIIPTIVNTTFIALKAVPKKFKEASFGLGANKITTIFKVCLPAAKPLIFSGLILAVGKAIGETMAVIMVSGNIANPPEILGTVRLLTTGIAIDLAYASGLLKHALFAIGLVLLCLIIIINLSFNLIFKERLLLNANNKL